MERTISLPRQARDVEVRAETFDEEARTVEVVWTTGARVRRRSWVDGPYDEELSLNANHVRLDRLNLGAPFLNSHDGWDLSGVIGSVVPGSAKIEKGHGIAKVQLSRRADVDGIVQDIRDGVIRNISVGYRVHKVEKTEGQEGGVPVWRVVDWEPLELSAVAIPADPGARTRDGHGRGEPELYPCVVTRADASAAPAATSEDTMPETVPAAVESGGNHQPPIDIRVAAAPAAPPSPPSPPALPAQPPAPVVDEATIRAEAQRAERERVATINEIAGRFNQREFADAHIRSGTAVDDFRARLIDRLAELQASGPRIGPGPVIERVGTDETETRRHAMRDAIVARMARASGERNVTIPDHARAYGEMSLVEMAAECIGHRDYIRTSRHVSEVFDRAFHSTSDFPGIFVDALNVRLLARYQAAAPVYRRFAAPHTSTDFRPTNVVRAGDFPALQPIEESGEIKAGTFSESKEVFRVYPYGISFNISRQMFINDNLMAVEQMLGSTGERVADWENAQAFAALLSGSGAGPVLLTDNKRVFHSDHGNLAGAGAAPDVTSVGAGRAAMMKQTTLDGIKANFTPVTLLCGPDKLTAAEQLLTSITPAQASNAVPESIRRLTPVGDANIPGNAWYLFADPAIAPCFVYGYLEGFEGPRLTTKDAFSVQGLRVKLEHDFGVSAIDYRGAYRNPGA